MDLRFDDDKGEDCLLSFDCTDLEIVEPSPYNRKVSKRWYSHKFKGPGLRYEIAIVISTGLIAWVNGPFPCGLFPDSKTFREEGLMKALPKGERVEADGGYKSLDPMYCKTPYGLTSKIKPERSKLSNRVRARQETINKRMKQFGILNHVYRHDINDHMSVFHAVAVLTQLEMINGQPLFEINNYE